MALFWCSKCGHIREVGNDYIGKSVRCPDCSEISPIHDSVVFIKELIQKHFALSNKFHKLTQELDKEGTCDSSIVEKHAFEDIDIHNTNVLTRAEQYEPIIKWFEKKNIQIQVDQDSIDTTGFFDEIAITLGDNYDALKFINEQIKYCQRKNYSNVRLDLSNKNKDEIKLIREYCQEMYDYSFVAKYFYSKKDNLIRLIIQSAPKIRRFFDGIWMEWFVLIKLLGHFRDHKINASCMKGIAFTLANGDSSELDIFYLTEKNRPVCIECKTGEFREDIDKYLKLRKQLNIDKTHFIICVFGLSQEQAQGMTSMYDLTFTNETGLMAHLEAIMQQE